MKNILSKTLIKNTLIVCLTFFLSNLFSQTTNPKPKSDFWKRVQIGGGIGLGIGSGFTDISLAPSAVYKVNNYFSAGVGLQGSYISVKNNYNSFIYGASIIGLINPVEQVQLSVELEEVNVNRSFTVNKSKDSFWNTALFLGAGYRMENLTVGIRYNVLFNKNDLVYSDAFMPFVRIYF